VTWEVPSVVAGVDDWPKRWREKADELVRVDWPNFRRNYTLMEGMQDPPSKLSAWLKRTRTLGIEDADLVEPEFGNPDGGVYSQRGVLTTTAARHGYYARQIFARAGGDIDGAHLLEIGGGFGGLVRALHRIPGAGGVGVSRVTLLDAPPCIELQTCYLRQVCQKLQVVDYSPDLVFDLVTNTHSLGEMTSSEVARYFGVIQTQVREGGYFYSANRLRRCVHFEDYPYDGQWAHEVWFTPMAPEPKWVECFSTRCHGALAPHPALALTTAPLLP